MAEKEQDKVAYNKIEVSKKAVVEEGTVERAKLKPVAKAKKQKKGLIERLVVGLIDAGDGQSVGQHLTQDIILPAVKNVIVDAITSGANMIFFGDQGGARKGVGSGGGYNYTKNYKSKNNYSRNREPERHQPRKNGRLLEFIFEDRTGAIDTLRALNEHIDEYDFVTVADYYDLIDEEPTYADNNYGWTDLSAAGVYPTRGGFYIKFPQPYQI